MNASKTKTTNTIASSNTAITKNNKNKLKMESQMKEINTAADKSKQSRRVPGGSSLHTGMMNA
ncbi:hypothetical protein E2C01_036259 [Portunus trituberculatus]|uniref:Uncharacterized protein n=1 Tax=Portunus trituberculatus TaxID=210409 RepID=A0A5B7FBZ0_PORTR|nr:hypothetical protein [Portunus trituberculatus]